MNGKSPVAPRERLFSNQKIAGEAPEDQRCLHLMFRGRMSALRGFYTPQRRKNAQPMPTQGKS